jgi:hypothetical protein
MFSASGEVDVPGSLAHKWYVVALVVVFIVVSAAAAVAAVYDWKGPWARGLALTAVAVVAVGGILDKVIVPRADAKRQRLADDEAKARRREEENRRSAEEERVRQEEDECARAVALELLEGNLAVMNQYRHVVTEVCVECWPLGAPPGDTSGWPKFTPAARLDDAVTYEVRGVGGLAIKVARIAPLPNPGMATGPTVGAWRLEPGGVSRMEFTVDWLDHQSRARRLCGVGDLADPFAAVKLNPPEPLFTETT